MASRVTGERDVPVDGSDPAEVLNRVRDGLIRRGRWVDPRVKDGVGFRGGWALAWRTASKPISGVVRISGDRDPTAHIAIRDAAIRAQLAMFGFERRQYRTTIDHELEQIQLDIGTAAGSASPQRGPRGPVSEPPGGADPRG